MSFVRLVSLPAGCIAVSLVAVFGAESPQPIHDEALRLAALRAVFPGMQVSIERGRQVKHVRPRKPKPGEISFPDAFADADVYLVLGEASNEAERTASENLATGGFSNTRRVRFKLFSWPAGGGLLGVFQYDFLGASPALSCPSVGLLVNLRGNADSWEIYNTYLLRASHHFSVQRIELLDLTGDGVQELVAESDFGGAGSVSSSLQVFDLTHGDLEELVSTNSRLEYMDEEKYTQVLDVDRTRKAHGQRFCTLKTTLFEKGMWFKPPRVTRPCYKRGDGVDPEDVKVRNSMLAPLR